MLHPTSCLSDLYMSATVTEKNNVVTGLTNAALALSLVATLDHA
jgi:hypothetical protein